MLIGDPRASSPAPRRLHPESIELALTLHGVSITKEKRNQFLATFRREAVHLEIRDVYATDIERDRFATWLRGEPLEPDAEAEWWRPWLEVMKRNTEAGKTLRRLRIVSEPVRMFDGCPDAVRQSSCFRETIFGCSIVRRLRSHISPVTAVLGECAVPASWTRVLFPSCRTPLTRTARL